MSAIKILVPIDFSDLSLLAFEASKVLSELFPVKVTPHHAFIPVADIDGLGYAGVGLSSSSQVDFGDIEPSLLDRLNEEAEKHLPKIILDKPIISVGNASNSIAKESENYDMIVMSTHGRTGFSRFLLGSVSEKVLRTSKCPVMVVEEESNFKPIERVLLTTDFSENSYSAFEWAHKFATKSKAVFDLIHVINFDDFDNMSTAQTFASVRKERLDKLVDEYFSEIKDRIRPEVILASESPHEAIFNLHQARNYNLVIMSTIGKTGLKYLTLGSTTASVVRIVDAPVLSINPKGTE